MIPQRLTLKNFLSYRETTVDFRGLHTACICGPNGAGKSSLLEAIAWAVWGESRAEVEDDVIHMGEAETQVDFVFVSHDRLYRVIRSRYRKQATGLEFQVAIDGREGEVGRWGGGEKEQEGNLPSSPPLPHSPSPVPPSSPALTFRSLTAKGIRATQQVILDHLKLDYDTFINSAYLRQGRADEFMLKRSSERKQILADLLKLDRYDELAERAKDESRQFKAQIEQQERNLAAIEAQLQQQGAIAQEQADLETQLALTQQQQEVDREQLQVYQTWQQQRQTWQQQLTWQQQQQRILAQDCQRLQQESIASRKQHQELENLLRQQEAIITGFNHFQTLQAQEVAFSARFKTYQTAQVQRQHYQQQQADRLHELQRQLQQTQAQIEALEQQETDLQQSLVRSAEVEAALASLLQARAQLTHLDQTQAQVAPLLQRRQQLQSQLDRAAARLSARLEELHTSAHHLQSQRDRQPQLQQDVVKISDRIETLEQRRTYQQTVLDKGMERRSFMERLQAEQRECEANLAEVEQKIQLLKQELPTELPTPPLQLVHSHPVSSHPASSHPAPSHLKVAESSQPQLYTLPHPPTPPLLHSYPPCPLCDRPLDEHHWQVVLEKHQRQQQEFLSQIWVIREQLSASEREIQVLRQEYRDIDKELGEYGTVLERRGQLQEQLQTTVNLQTSLRQVMAEVELVQQSLEAGNFAQELQEELHLLDRSLHELHYDERDHALARGQVDRWRWAEIKQAEIKQSQRKQSQIRDRLPGLQAQQQELQAQTEQRQQQSQTDLNRFDQHLAAIGYDLEQHNQLQADLRQAQPWQLRYQELYRAQQSYPRSRERIEELLTALQERQAHLNTAHTHVQALTQQLEQLPDCQPQIQAIEQQMQQRRSQLDDRLAHLGRLQQQQRQLDSLRAQGTRLSSQLDIARRRLRVYQELAQAFGKNGIQTLMIENVLPQLEAETNHILGRLSANQLHVQFITQRSNRRDQGKTAKLKSQTTKMIETLDILIADAHGTRPYETYSGGEAFRVNFAIRLALSRLLAQRSGTALQLLVIDEGFGTQDQEGCDRLVAAINAIASDFACILAVTHVPHLKEAFQSRIEVYKTENGSQVSMAASL